MVRQGELLEHAEFVGNCYGTPRAPVLEQLRQGVTVILDIEVQGARQVKALMPEAISVFLSPPVERAGKRLRGRGRSRRRKSKDGWRRPGGRWNWPGPMTIL